MEFQPRYFQAVLSALISISFLYAYLDEENHNIALVVGFWVFFVITGIMIYMLVYANHFQQAIKFMEMFIKLDAQGREMLAYHLPVMRLTMFRGKVRKTFENTQVSPEQFRLFLTDSTNEFTASERNWDTAERPRWVYREIIEWLIDHKKVLKDSYSGNRSWKWIGNSYRQLCAYWIEEEVVNLNEMERIFASEE